MSQSIETIERNGKFTGFPESAVESNLGRRFEEMAALFPEHTAVQTSSMRFSYGALNRWANRIAHALAAGSGAVEEPIGVLLESGDALVAAVIAVFKTGKLLVPLDPSYPEERLAAMLADSGAVRVISNPRNQSLALRLLGVSEGIINLDALPANLSEHNPSSNVSPTTLAYLLYSSGSTGKPKGIVHSHRNALQNIRNYSSALGLGATDRVVMLHSISFSSGVNDVLFTLLNGAALFPWDIKTRGLEPLVPWLSQQQITILNWSPSTYRHLLEMLEPEGRLPFIRAVVLGSEPVTRVDWELYCRHFGPDCVFVHRLGSTECNNYRLNFLRQNSEPPRGLIPAGYAVQEKEVLILDESGQPVVTGETGQIAVRSRYLSPGYWKRPDLTAAAFLPGPNGGDDRIYLTGDFGRLYSDGNLEYLGRRDSQLKFHGVRIEAAEIELALTGHPGIRDAIVIVHTDDNGHQCLAGYVLARSSPAPTAQELHRSLSSRLPPSMVPSAFVFLDAFPLTPSGKVDRRALPPPVARTSDARPYTAPTSPTEETLAGIWGQVLRLERIGREDHFFNLGGQSLTAVRMLARLRAVLHVDVPLRALFEAPTLAGFADRVDELTRAGNRSAADAEGMAEGTRLPPRPTGQRLPLTPTQEQLCFLQRLEPDNPAYNVSVLVKWGGQLDVSVLRRALDELLRRHDILRSVIVEKEGVPEHRISLPAPCPLPIIDLAHVTPAGREAAARELADREARVPFDLATGPLLRTQLLRLDPTTHWLVLSVHHVIFDGSSTSILLDELAGLYSAFATGGSAILPDTRLQFADFAQWKHANRQGERHERELSYWKNQLAGSPELLELPVDHPRSVARGNEGGCLEFQLPGEILRQLTVLAREEQCTTFMVLLAAYQMLLSQYSRQDDICVGSPLAGRTLPETERMIGYFANTVVLRAHLSGNPTFREFLRQVRATVFAAFAHQETPLEHVVAALNPHRIPGQSPLFQAALVFNQEALAPTPFHGLSATADAIHNGGAKFDLTLTLRERTDRLTGALEYRSRLFSTDSMQRLVAHFSLLVEQVVACPDANIESFHLLAPAERHLVLQEWNDTAREYPHAACVHELIERQAERKPQATALVSGTDHISYQELNQRANQLARLLQRHGVGPDVLVGIFLDRSIDMVIALLAVLKAGGAYVPLDPQYPSDRLAFIVADAQVAVLLTQDRLRPSLPVSSATVIDVTSCRPTDQSSANPFRACAAHNLAYVIFTSGSTGRPKGVAIEHRSVVAFATWAQTVFTDDEFSGVLFSTSICFDLSVFELFVTLIAGGKVILAANALELPTLPAVNEVSLINTVPSAMAELIRRDGIPASVRTVNLGGEAVPQPLVDEVYRVSSAQKVYDLYGPTEDTVYSTFALRTAGGRATIGRPIANTQTYILDARQQPVPVGVPGELYLGGAGLARGYLNRPELTNERFVPHPFSRTVGSRLYRTGDLCRYLGDGRIEFLGRMDHQLKIRGFRVELGEIEAVLQRSKRVRACVVVARDDESGDKRLVAYVVPQDGDADPLSRELEALLRSQLPDYMVPSAFVILPQLPLTPNGKLDRRALPAPTFATRTAERSGASAVPRTPMEHAVAEIWASVLGVKSVGVDDNFFELGGHSLLASRMASRLDKLTGRRVPISMLFHAPTVSTLARALEQDGAVSPFTSLVPLQREGSGPPLFCVHGWGGDLFCFTDLARELAPDFPVYGLQAVGLDGRQPRHATVEEMAAHYCREIRTFQPEGPYYLAGYSLGGWIAYAVAQELQAQGQTVAMLGLLDTRATSDVPWQTYMRGVVPYLGRRIGLHFKHWIEGPPKGRLHYLRHGTYSLFRHFRVHKLWQQCIRAWNARITALPGKAKGASAATPQPQGDHYVIAASRYRPTRYRGNIELFVGEDIKGFMYAFWRHLTSGRVHIHRVAGTHHSLLSDEHIEGFAAAFKRILTQVRERHAAAPRKQ